MRFYSDKTKELYDTEELLNEAEVKFDEAAKAEEEKKAERAKRAKEVEDAFAVAADAKQHANDLLEAFCADYGSYHTTIRNTSLKDFFRDPFQFLI